MVIGMGENKTPEPFRKACDKFTILENLMSEQNPWTSKYETSHDKRSKEKIEDASIKLIIENQDMNKPTGLGEVGSRFVSLYQDFEYLFDNEKLMESDKMAYRHILTEMAEMDDITACDSLNYLCRYLEHAYEKK